MPRELPGRPRRSRGSKEAVSADRSWRGVRGKASQSNGLDGGRVLTGSDKDMLSEGEKTPAGGEKCFQEGRTGRPGWVRGHRWDQRHRRHHGRDGVAWVGWVLRRDGDVGPTRGHWCRGPRGRGGYRRKSWGREDFKWLKGDRQSGGSAGGDVWWHRQQGAAEPGRGSLASPRPGPGPCTGEVGEAG